VDLAYNPSYSAGEDQEEEIERIMVQSQPRQKVSKIPL
jgi:hypothetical protein